MSAKRARSVLYALLALAVVLFGLDRAAAYLHVPASDSREVVLYGTDWCPFCRALRTHFAINGIPFQEYDVESSLQGIMGFWALRGRSVPITVVGPEVIYGFRLGKIDAALQRLGYSVSLVPGGRAPGADELPPEH